MSIQKIYKVIGIMSGTSMDGVDISFIETDGENYASIICEKSYDYSNNYKIKLIKLINQINLYRINNKKKIDDDFITNKFISFIKKFIKEKSISKDIIDFIGFSGQTIVHDPKNRISIQLGSCKKIQKKLKIKIIGNFRDNDIKQGGEGAPIGAFYHKYILQNFKKKSAIINIGGITNITYCDKNKLIAFDIGPGNSIIDDLSFYFYKNFYDKDGQKAFKGKIDIDFIKKYKNDLYFKLKYPKSLDRNYFHKYTSDLKNIKNIDAISTASKMTVESIILGLKILNKKINNIIITGGGRKNKFIINNLKKYYNKRKIKIILIDKLKINGDFIESQTFAYLAVRTIKKLPLSLPTTTGVKKPTSGGEIFE